MSENGREHCLPAWNTPVCVSAWTSPILSSSPNSSTTTSLKSITTAPFFLPRISHTTYPLIEFTEQLLIGAGSNYCLKIGQCWAIGFHAPFSSCRGRNTAPSWQRMEMTVGLARCHMRHTHCSKDKRAFFGPETGKDISTQADNLGRGCVSSSLSVRKCPKPQTDS